jgi:hypothetical protein
MHHTIQQLFDEHESPSHASAAHTHEVVGHVLELVADLQQQALVYKRLMWAWKTAPDAEMKDKLEWFKQTFDAGETALTELSRAAERLVDGWAQLDRYMAIGKADIASVLSAPPATDTVA